MRVKSAIAVLSAIAAITVALDLAGWLAPMNERVFDAQIRILRKWFPAPAAHDVVVVGIDEKTLRQLPEPIALWHRHLADFLAAMRRAKPSAVGLDMVLPDRSFESVLPGSDRILLKSLVEARHAYPLVLAMTVDPEGKTRAVYPPFLGAAGPGGAGYALFPVDGDGRVRRFDEHLGASGEEVRTLAGQMARRLGVKPGSGLIDYWHGAAFGYVPFQRILRWAAANNERALERTFRGRPVILGMNLPFTDRHRVPLSLAAWAPTAPDTPGVLLHAQALRNLLGGGFIKTVPVSVRVAAIVAAALLWFVSGQTAWVMFLLFGLGVAGFAGATWLLAQGWFFPIAAPLLGTAAALGGRNALDTTRKLLERKRLRGSFSGYVSPAVMDEILAGHITPDLGGTSKFVCVMFSDIRGYTARSEAMDPEQVVRFLNRYFERVVTLIHGHGGTVSSFMGDGVMAVFGAPKPLDHPCSQAFETARKMLRYVSELNEEFRAEGEPPMDIGIGLHAGQAVIGHVGSAARHDYTAIGDVTNVASRLESLTKETGCRIVVSKSVAECLGAADALRNLGPMAIKGHSPLEVYGFDDT